MGTLIGVILLLALNRFAQGAANHCKPCDPCWPSEEVIAAFGQTLEGKVLQPIDVENFQHSAVVYNHRLFQQPGIIVEPQRASDVQKAVAFAKTHNIKLTVKSSGHDFSGRCAEFGSLTINMRYFRKITVNMADSESDTGASITAEPGANWSEMYQEADKYGRVVMGGSSGLVAMGGYTTGGGHSPMSRSLGLGVDNAIAFTIVTADALIRKCNASGCIIVKDDGSTEVDPNGSDLWWAVRGGGASFGYLTSVTFKMHVPPDQFVQLSIGWPISTDSLGDVGKRVINFYNSFVQSMSSKWGGYLLTNNGGPIETPGFTYDGTITMSLLHYGEWADAYRSIEPLLKVEQDAQLYSTLTNYSTYWEYQSTVDDYAPLRLYLINKMIQPSDLTENFTKLMTQDLLDNPVTMGCTLTHLGGKVSDSSNPPASVSEGFRGGIFSMSCGTGWQSEYLDDYMMNSLRQYNKELSKFGKGMYYNEPDMYAVDWKNEFWYPNYDRLAQIKRSYDPDHVFTCNKCVGWDDVTNTTATSGADSKSEGFAYIKYRTN